MLQVSEFAALLSSSLFSGEATYINVVEYPARMECGTELATTVFGPSYKRAAVMQAALALIATASAVASWLLGASVLWLVTIGVCRLAIAIAGLHFPIVGLRWPRFSEQPVSRRSIWPGVTGYFISLQKFLMPYGTVGRIKRSGTTARPGLSQT